MLIIKVGGGTAVNKTGIVQDIKNLKRQVIFVHGARHQADQLAQKLGIPTQRITSPGGLESILTDKKTLEIMTMAYSGLVNKQWIELFQQHSLNAVGLSGADGRIWLGERKPYLIAQIGKKPRTRTSSVRGRQKLIQDTWTGRVNAINSHLLKLLLKYNYLPVITQPALSQQGELINTDNDRNLAVMAKALKIKQLVVLFEAPGLLKNYQDESSLIKKVKKQDLPIMMQYARGTMKKKILGAKEAFAAGVKTIYWADARVAHPITNALAGKGTVIR